VSAYKSARKHDLGGVAGVSVKSAQRNRGPVGAGLPALSSPLPASWPRGLSAGKPAPTAHGGPPWPRLTTGSQQQRV